MMLSLDTAYRSFGGEVEASSTPTICRLSDSRRHQLSAIALAVARVALSHLLHGLFIGDCTSLMVELVAVAIECGDCCDVIRLSPRLGRRRHRLGDCLGAGLERGWLWIGAGVRRRSAPRSVFRHLQNQAFSLRRG